MTEPVFQKNEIKNFLVNRSFFTKKAKSLNEYFDRFACIQVDPIVYIAKSHEISLEFYQDHLEEVEMARGYIKGMGPTTANDLKHIPQTRALFEWTSTKSNKATLDYLWDRGEITISHRKRSKKYYDLTERVLPEEILSFVDEETSLEYLVKSNFMYLGVVRRSVIWKTGRSIKDKIYKKFDEMIEKGIITQIKVEGIKTKYYVLTDDIPLIKSSGKQMEHDGLTIIPPFDQLITDRKILSDFFNYDYQWQFYWPPSKRTFNPYGMPLLYKGEVVGEIGLSKENSHKRLYVTELESSVDTFEFRSMLDSTVRDLEMFVFDY